MIRRRPSPVPFHIREQWLRANAYRYTDKEFAQLMAVSEITVRMDRLWLGLRKYRCDSYHREHHHYPRRVLEAVAA